MVDFSQSEEHKTLIETARRFTRERIIPVAAECDRESRFPMDVFKQGWEIGLINIPCPAEYGGSGMGLIENTLVVVTGVSSTRLSRVRPLAPVEPRIQVLSS